MVIRRFVVVGLSAVLAGCGAQEAWLGAPGDSSVRSASLSTWPSQEATQELVAEAYRTHLRREPDPGGLAHWSAAVNARVLQGESRAGAASFLAEAFRASDEYQALVLTDDVFEEVLGRRPGNYGYWHEVAVRMRLDQRRSFESIRAHLRAVFLASEEYALKGRDRAFALVNGAFERVLRRTPEGWGYWHDRALERLQGGEAAAAVAAWVEANLRQSDEYVFNFLSEVVADLYRELLLREPDPQGLAHWVALGEGLKAQGKGGGEIRGAIAQGLRSSAEYRKLHPRNDNRDDWYLPQRDNCNCGPHSVTMALAAFGLRPATYETMNQVRVDLAPGCGVPGDGSLVAASARRFGLQAVFSTSQDVAQMRRALQEGKGIIVNGAISPWVGHFIYIGGLDEFGRYIVGDPYRSWITRWSDADLQTFMFTPGHPPGFVSVWN